MKRVLELKAHLEKYFDREDVVSKVRATFTFLFVLTGRDTDSVQFQVTPDGQHTFLDEEDASFIVRALRQGIFSV